MIRDHCIAIGIHMIGIPEFSEHFALHIQSLAFLHMIEKNIIVLNLEGIHSGVLTGYESVVLCGMRFREPALGLNRHCCHGYKCCGK